MKANRRLKRLLATSAAALAALAALPSLASALTISVDDDRVQCPLADYTSLNAAVAAAANGDEVKVCAGTYEVPGGPAPSSGLRIEKNISIAGAGADKVFVQPEQGTEPMAEAIPNPRDEYGNVITVRRRLIELYEVSISGLTVRAGNVPVEAGISMIDVVTGSISGVKVEGIVPETGPGTGAFEPPAELAQHGQGIIVANTIDSTQNETTISGSSVSGFNATGVLVDSRYLSGTGQVGNDAHVTAKIVDTTISGAGGTPPVAQTGVEAWGQGARVQIADSAITGVGTEDGSAAAVALHGVDVAASAVGGTEADAVELTGNAYGITNVAYDGAEAELALNAKGNSWGTTVDGGTLPLVGSKVEYDPLALAPPPAPAIDPVLDLAPTVQWDTGPKNGGVVVAGSSVPLAAVAADDFGVSKVEFLVDGASIGVSPTPELLGERVYTASWTPAEQSSGTGHLLEAVATDSGGQTTIASVTVTIAGKPRFAGSPGTLSGTTAGYAVVGKALTCSSGSPAGYPAPTVSYSWTSSGSPVGANSATYTPVASDQGKSIVCSVELGNSYGSASQAGGPALVATGPAFASPAVLGGASGLYALVGDELTCSAGAASGNPVPTVAYSWKRGAATIAGEVASTYEVTAADVGSAVTCVVTATSATGASSTTAAALVGAAPQFTAAAAVVGGTVSGYAVAGQALTCSTGSPSGFPAPTVTYSWTAGGAPVGGNSATYVPTAADQGKLVGCEVAIANPLGGDDQSGATVPVATGPSFTAPAALSGAGGAYAMPGEEIVCAAAAAGVPVPGVAYTWLRDGVPSGHTGSTRTVEEEDAGHVIACRAEATSIAGTVASLAEVAVGSAPKGGGAELAGASRVGSELSCASGPWTAIPAAAVTYRWLRDGAPIPGATGSTYGTSVAEVGKSVSCEATAANELGTATAVSAAIKVKAAPPSVVALDGPRKLKKGKAKVGQVSCDLGPCSISGPKRVAVKIGGKKYKVAIVFPGKLGGGKTGPVLVRAGKAARKALAKAGSSGPVRFKLKATGGGGAAGAAFGLRLT